MKLTIALLLILVLANAEVSLFNLQKFWEATYDPNKDGVSTIQEFADFFRIM